ncbi:MAG: hypothetical protein RLZZ165_2415 [Bacteroidota bacterium]|jgi:tetratricopeptide (TPR) repeat protein
MRHFRFFGFFFLLLFLGWQTICGQSALKDAFAKSYAHEASQLYAAAINDLQAVYDARSYELNMRIGWLCYMDSRPTDAVKYYETAMKLKPYAIEPKFGYIYPATVLENWDAIKKCYEDILAIAPQNTQALYGLGNIYYYREDYVNAYTNFEKVVNLYPFDGPALLMLGWTCLQQAKKAEAKVLFEKALIYDPTNKSALEGWGLAK